MISSFKVGLRKALFGSAKSKFQILGIGFCDFNSSTICTALDCPKIPPSEKFVPPVKIAWGSPSLSITMNLLCEIADEFTVRLDTARSNSRFFDSAIINLTGTIFSSIIYDSHHRTTLFSPSGRPPALEGDGIRRRKFAVQSRARAPVDEIDHCLIKTA